MPDERLRRELRDRVATRIKARRMKLGLSLSEAAKRAGLSKAHLSKLEDDCNPSVETLYVLANAYCCEMSDLLPIMADVKDSSHA